MKLDRIDAAILIAVALLMIAATAPWMASLGMEYDEAHFLDSATRIVAGSPERLKPPDGFYLDHRPLPFMTMPYVGALNGWLMAIPLKLFGFHQTVSRSVNLAVGILIVALAYAFAKSLGGRGAAIVAAALLVADLEFLLHVPVHYGPFLLQMLAAVAMAWLIDKWLAGEPHRFFYWACFAAGIGFQEKLTFVWFLFLYVAALLLFRARDVFRRLTLKVFFIGFGIFLLSMLPVLWYTIGRPEVVLGFSKSAASAPAGWEVLADRFRMFHKLLTGQEFLKLQAGIPPLVRFSALAWLFWAGFALAAIQKQKTPLMFCSIGVGLVALNALFPEGGRLHHLLLAYPLIQVGAAVTLARWRLPLAVAVLLLIPTAWSTAAHLRWYSSTVEQTGGENHWSSAIYDLAQWIRERPGKHYYSSAWGFYRPLFTLTGGELSIRDRYFELMPDPMPADLRNELGNQVRRRGSYWITSRIIPQYEANLRRLFAIAAEEGLQPKLVQTFRRKTGDEIYQVYSFHDEDESAWRPLPVSASAPLNLEIPLPAGVRDVRFRLPARNWSRALTIAVELAGGDGKRVAAWWRTVEFYPLIWPQQQLEFGPELYPDYFVPLPGGTPAEPRFLRVVVESKTGPVDFEVTGLEVR
jgi:4-amino-4-deoxy-L-arabinose transferase-like glycosyltransferase